MPRLRRGGPNIGRRLHRTQLAYNRRRNRTEEQRIADNAITRIRTAISRANETEERRNERLQNDRLRHKESRQRVIYERRARNRQGMRERRQLTRASINRLEFGYDAGINYPSHERERQRIYCKKNIPPENLDTTMQEDETNIAKDSKTKKQLICRSENSKDPEIVDGLEMSVECASDEESSEDDKGDESIQPISKTTIVKNTPNDSELEMSASESEKSEKELVRNGNNDERIENNQFKEETTVIESDVEDCKNIIDDVEKDNAQTKISETATMKKTDNKRVEIKKEEESSEDEESNHRDVESNVNDKLKSIKKDKDDINSENENSHVKNEEVEESEDKKMKVTEGNKERNTDNENDDEKPQNGENNKKLSKFDDQIINLKKYIKAAGIRVKKYDDLWLNCKNNKEKIERLKELLKENGVSGRVTMEKCKMAKIKREQDREIAELDPKNIISEGRVTRSSKNLTRKRSPPPSNSQEKSSRQQDIRKRIRCVIDSDSE